MKKLVVSSGAGISAQSGITTFRDAGGLWENYPVMDVASHDGFLRNPALIHKFYNERRAQLVEVEPNAAHRGLVELEKYFDVDVITQNVDDLHERAGSSNVLHLHGELMKATSSANPNDPKCIVSLTPDKLNIEIGDKAKDGSQLRPFIVWFGEAVPKMEEAAKAAMEADIFVIIGTSLNVYPAAGLVSYVPRGAQLYLIDPKPVKVPYGLDIHTIQKGASEGMRELMEILLAQQ